MVSNKRKGFKFQSKPKSVNNQQNSNIGENSRHGSANISLFNSGRRVNTNSSSKNRRSKRQYNRSGYETLPPVSGRKHVQIQTSKYLEEICDIPKETTTYTQTDAELDYCEPVLFIPQTSGISVSTQIENGDLFNFDVEVEPILETLIGKTLDISLMQVSEETELQALQRWKEIYQQRRNAELTECQRLQEIERRLFEEKERRKRQARLWKEQQKTIELEKAAKRIAKNNLDNVKINAIEQIEKESTYKLQLSNFISKNILPRIYINVAETLKPRKTAINIVDRIIKEISDVLSTTKIASNQKIKDVLKCREEARQELLRQTNFLSDKMKNIKDLFESFVQSEDETILKFEIQSLLKIKTEKETLKEKVPEEVEEEDAENKGDEEEAEKVEESTEDENSVKKEEEKVEKEIEYEVVIEINEEEVQRLEGITEKFKSEPENCEYLVENYGIKHEKQIDIVLDKIKLIDDYLKIHELRNLGKRVLELFETFSDEDKESKMKELNIKDMEKLSPKNIEKWNLDENMNLKELFEDFIEKNEEKPAPEEEENEAEPEES